MVDVANIAKPEELIGKVEQQAGIGEIEPLNYPRAQNLNL
jgi:hypothetical protein